MTVSGYVPHYVYQPLPDLQQDSLSLVFDRPDPVIKWRDISLSMALAARQKAATLVDLKRRILRVFISNMESYRDYRLQELFLEEKPLDEQLSILRQNLKDPGDGPPLEMRIAPEP